MQPVGIELNLHQYRLTVSHALPDAQSFHLVVETLQPNLMAGMKWFLGTYTSRFNWQHKFFGQHALATISQLGLS